MADLAELGCARLASVSAVDLNTASDTDLYVIPAGKKCVVHFVVIRELSANATNAVVTLGENGAMTDFLGNQTLSNLNAAGSAGILMPIPNATTVEIQEYSAGETFCIDVTTQAGIACTCTVEVYGSLLNA